MSEKKQMLEVYERLMDYERQQHERNQKRIRIGIRLLWIIPLIFLALLFITNSSKIIFLVLWIVSLFGIAIYLILVEYTDYNLQERLREISGDEDEINALLTLDEVEEKVNAATERANELREKHGQLLQERRRKALQKFREDAEDESVQASSFLEEEVDLDKTAQNADRKGDQ